jgi:hypothetical protein
VRTPNAVVSLGIKFVGEKSPPVRWEARHDTYPRKHAERNRESAIEREEEWVQNTEPRPLPHGKPRRGEPCTSQRNQTSMLLAIPPPTLLGTSSVHSAKAASVPSVSCRTDGGAPI